LLQLIVAGLTVGSTYALVALGIHIVLRATRVINFAQGEFVILGGLLAFTVVNQLHQNVWVGLLAATVGGFLIGLIYERIVLRPAARISELTVTIATIGTVSVLLYGHAMLWGSLPEPLPAFLPGDSYHLGGVSIQRQSIAILVLLALALAALYAFFERTTFGKAIRAAANDPLGARLVGIDVDRARAISVAISIALAAFAGTIIGPLTLVGGAAGTAITIKGFVGAIVGGLESPVACALGGLLVGVAQKLIEGQFSYGVADPAVYTLLLVMLLLRPRGLLGARAVTRD